MIKTIVSNRFEVGNNQINPIKGKALEFLVQKVLKEPTLKEKKIKDIFVNLLNNKENIPNIYRSNITFQINDKKFLKNVPFFYSDLIFGRVHGIETFVEENHFLLKCINKNCKNKNSSFKTTYYKGRCVDCNSKLDYLIRKLEKDVEHFLSNNINEIFKFLIENNFIEPMEHFLNRRADFIQITDGKMIILESKNNEISGIDDNTIKISLVYPLLLKKLNLMINEGLNIEIKDLEIYTNGELYYSNDLFENVLQLHKINVRIIEVFDLLRKSNINEKNIYGCRVSYDNISYKYIYEILLSKERNEEIIIFIDSVKIDKKNGEKIKNVNFFPEKNDSRLKMFDELTD